MAMAMEQKKLINDLREENAQLKRENDGFRTRHGELLTIYAGKPCFYLNYVHNSPVNKCENQFSNCKTWDKCRWGKKGLERRLQGSRFKLKTFYRG